MATRWHLSLKLQYSSCSFLTLVTRPVTSLLEDSQFVEILCAGSVQHVCWAGDLAPNSMLTPIRSVQYVSLCPQTLHLSDEQLPQKTLTGKKPGEELQRKDRSLRTDRPTQSTFLAPRNISESACPPPPSQTETASAPTGVG